MEPQNLKNHVRYVPMFHFVLFGLIVLTLIGACVNLYQSVGNHDRVYSASLILVMCVSLVMLFFFTRIFAAKAQDRAIKADEGLRHYILTGKPLDPRLEVPQIVALRFAPDEEFPALAKRAAEQKLPPIEIKKAIKNWRGDYYRV